MLPVISDAERLSRRIGEATQHIEAAAERTIASRNEGWVAQEPHLTDRLLGRIEDAVNQFEGDGVRWKARTLTDHGPGTEEKRFGADFLGVFEVTTAGLTIAKGFLSQAKILEEGKAIAAAEHNRLRQQCRRMLERTPDSFVFLYGHQEVRVVSAVAVLGSDRRNLDELGVKPIGEFFFDHFRCFVGDPSLTAPIDLPVFRWWAPVTMSFLDVRRALIIEAIGQRA